MKSEGQQKSKYSCASPEQSRNNQGVKENTAPNECFLKQFNLEPWYSAAQERWLEVSSVSNFETFQANRLKLRFKDEEGKSQLCHTLNGSAMALPRVLAALLENHQQADGIRIPEALVSYAGFDKIS